MTTSPLDTVYIRFQDGALHILNPSTIPLDRPIPKRQLSFTKPPTRPSLSRSHSRRSQRSQRCRPILARDGHSSFHTIKRDSYSHPKTPQTPTQHPISPNNEPSTTPSPPPPLLIPSSPDEKLTTPISAISRQDLFTFLLSRQASFRVLIDNRPEAKLHPSDAGDLEIIIGLIGGGKKDFVFDVEEVCCWECVRREEEEWEGVKTSKEALLALHAKFTYALHNPKESLRQLTNALSGIHNHTPCTHSPPFFRLFNNISAAHREKLTHIVITGPITHNNGIFITASAFANLSSMLPALRKVTIHLSSSSSSSSSTFPSSSPSPPSRTTTTTTSSTSTPTSSVSPHRQDSSNKSITNATAYRLARIFAAMEKRLPHGERLKIKGLERVENKALRREWARRVRGYWLSDVKGEDGECGGKGERKEFHCGGCRIGMGYNGEHGGGEITW